MVRVAVNGFGRIGRPFFRMCFDDPDIEIVGVNDRKNPKLFAHLLKYDSTFGTWDKEVSYDDSHVLVNGKSCPIFTETDVSVLPWKELGVDVVLECTGRYTDATKAVAHLEAGAKKVLISAPGKNDDLTVCYGINHQEFDPNIHNIISNASCTTNGMAAAVKVLDDNFGIVKGMMCTVHAYTNDQNILDRSHKDLRRARAAACSIIPTTTGAAKAIGKVLPQLRGKMNGFALRVPTPNVSIIDLDVLLSRPVTAQEINAALKKASEGEFKGILGYTEDELVSIDYKGMEYAGCIDAASTMVVCGDLAKIIIWYDNEWGYTCRVKDMIKYMGEKMA